MKNQGPTGNNVACRQHAKGVLEDQIRRAERELQCMKDLLEVIPWDSLTNSQEENLWSYFIKNRGF